MAIALTSEHHMATMTLPRNAEAGIHPGDNTYLREMDSHRSIIVESVRVSYGGTLETVRPCCLTRVSFLFKHQ